MEKQENEAALLAEDEDIDDEDEEEEDDHEANENFAAETSSLRTEKVVFNAGSEASNELKLDRLGVEDESDNANLVSTPAGKPMRHQVRKIGVDANESPWVWDTPVPVKGVDEHWHQSVHRGLPSGCGRCQ